jgi:hypothetical protein
MPHPATVWAVELTLDAPLEEVKGSLTLEPDALVFTPNDVNRAERRLSLSGLIKVHRLRGSPVLMVVREEGRMHARTAFYFVQPPPLDRPEAQARPGFLGIQRNVQRKARRQNLGYLGVWNREKRFVVREWERAIRTALASVRG